MSEKRAPRTRILRSIPGTRRKRGTMRFRTWSQNVKGGSGSSMPWWCVRVLTRKLTEKRKRGDGGTRKREKGS
jgi:hypothetical protein